MKPTRQHDKTDEGRGQEEKRGGKIMEERREGEHKVILMYFFLLEVSKEDRRKKEGLECGDDGSACSQTGFPANHSKTSDCTDRITHQHVCVGR